MTSHHQRENISHPIIHSEKRTETMVEWGAKILIH